MTEANDKFTQDPRLVDLTKRVIRLTSNAGVTIGQCSLVHVNCLVSLALEMTHGDREQAIQALRETFAAIERDMRDPTISFHLIEHRH